MKTPIFFIIPIFAISLIMSSSGASYAGPGGQNDDNSPAERIAAAEKLSRKGMYEDAMRIYEGVLKQKPFEETALENLAEIYKRDGRVNEAAALYEKLFKKEIGRLISQGRRELSERALKIYHTVDTLKQGNPRVFTEMASDLMAIGKLAWAKQELENAIALDPGYSDAYFYFSKYHMMKGDLPAAVKSLEKAVELKPKNYQARNNLGGLYIEMNKPDLAIEQFNQAIKTKKDETTSYYNLGIAYALKGDYKNAVASLKEAIRINPAHMDAQFVLANLYYEKLDDKRAAYPLYLRVLRTKDDITGNEVLMIQGRIAEIRESEKARAAQKKK